MHNWHGTVPRGAGRSRAFRYPHSQANFGFSAMIVLTFVSFRRRRTDRLHETVDERRGVGLAAGQTLRLLQFRLDRADQISLG